MDQQYQTPKQAALRIGVSRFQLLLWRLRKVGPVYYKFGRHVRYHPEELEQWNQEGRRLA